MAVGADDRVAHELARDRTAEVFGQLVARSAQPLNFRAVVAELGLEQIFSQTLDGGFALSAADRPGTRRFLGALGIRRS